MTHDVRRAGGMPAGWAGDGPSILPWRVPDTAATFLRSCCKSPRDAERPKRLLGLSWGIPCA
eukprot:5846803-Prymnesium_polylepis.2